MSVNNQPELIKVFDSNLKEEFKLISELSPEGVAVWYAKATHAYLKSRNNVLQQLIEALDFRNRREPDSFEWAHKIAQVRLQIRTCRFNQDLLDQLETNIDASGIWQGEIAFVLGMAYETLENNPKAEKFYMMSFQSFEKLGVQKKAIKALHNAIAARSRIPHTEALTHELHTLHEKAMEAEAYDVAGMALNNLSREFQKMGAIRVALKYSNQAVELIRKNMFGSRTYFLTLCNRAHILLDMDLFSQAVEDYEEAQTCSMKELRAAVHVLFDVFRSRGIEVMEPSFGKSNRRLKTWEQRKQRETIVGERKEVSLSPLQSKLVSLLTQGPRSKQELMEVLFEIKEDEDSLSDTCPKVQKKQDTRFRQLIFKIRQKRPSLIVHEDGQYMLGENLAS